MSAACCCLVRPVRSWQAAEDHLKFNNNHNTQIFEFLFFLVFYSISSNYGQPAGRNCSQVTAWCLSNSSSCYGGYYKTVYGYDIQTVFWLYNRGKGSFAHQRDTFCQNDLKCSQNITDDCCNWGNLKLKIDKVSIFFIVILGENAHTVQVMMMKRFNSLSYGNGDSNY